MKIISLKHIYYDLKNKLAEQEQLLNDEENEMCEHCGKCHSDLDECFIDEQEAGAAGSGSIGGNTTANIAGYNLPLGSKGPGNKKRKKY
jgi:hypothetical protein